MKLLPLASPLATLLASAALFSEARGQTSQLVYSQNFNSAAIDTTGTGLNDGSNMVDNIANYAHNRVWYSTSWGSLPAGQEWKALFMTPMGAGILSNFFMPVKNTGQSVSSFSADFTLLNNFSNYTAGANGVYWGDGFSMNFGKFNNTTNAIGGYLGMYTPAGGVTGNVLTLSVYTYLGDAPRFELSYNGSVVATNPMDPYYSSASPAPASAFIPINFSYDSNGVDVTYFGTSVFSNVAVAGFTPGVNDSFAMQARTGVAYENLFVDDIAINTTVAPFTLSGGAGSWTTAGGWAIGTAPTTNNNWIVMAGAGGNSNNNAVTAMEGLVFGSAATGSYVLSGNAFTSGADGIANNSSSAQTVSSDLTLGAAQTFNAASGALTFNGTINAGSNALTVSGSNAVTMNGAVSGTGSLTKTGAGTLTLAGTNTYSAGTTVSAGILKGTSTSIQGAVTNNAAVTFDQAASGSYAGAMSGTGSLSKSDIGTLKLAGTNTYSGVTTISAGTLQFTKTASLYNSSAASWTAANLSVASGATAAFNVGGAGEFTSGNIDTLKALGGATNGFKSGSSIGLDTSSGNFSYASAIANPNSGSNALGLVKLGSNTLTLSGANTYTGATTVSAGALAVNGSITSAVTVASGGTLKGSGTITGNTSISNGGTLAPGNSINTLSVVGDLSFTTGSIFEWELDTTQLNPTTNRGTAYDAVNVTGSVTGDAIFKIVLMGTTGFAGSFWNTSRTWANIFANGGTPISTNLGTVFTSFQYSYDNGSGTLTTAPSSAGSFSFSGSSLVYSAVPEPSNAVAGLLLTALLLRRRR